MKRNLCDLLPATEDVRAVELGYHNYPWFERDKTFDKLRNNLDYCNMMTAATRA